MDTSLWEVDRLVHAYSMAHRLVSWSAQVSTLLCPRDILCCNSAANNSETCSFVTEILCCGIMPLLVPAETHAWQLGSMLGSNRNNRIPGSVVAQHVGSLVSDLAIIASICLYDFTLFVIDIHQNMSISPFLTPFDHFHFRPTSGLLSSN